MNTCATCLYWHQTSCHRYPPIALEKNRYTSNGVVGDTIIIARFPTTTADEWCGEWRDKDQDANVFDTLAKLQHFP